ncbi:NAD(P)-dependent iron-only hydrogenase catalytic subunit [Peptoclostridium litorale DSM 5388]|uniref:NADP-reducing hydrogenase subunit HndC n=1 Tax=Peptoclostridium litorale DSM 5388 TaxID=1121324 RepID=A0A069RCS2_PEPLI|nr:NADH-dependent [FeFe] hydrogenase, group A6 [Peptoclostridium litorale]KDR94859.1 NADP-reducing hydrogenase subunit HndC [Peptoclostridium litorale DSM 5388]SIN94276.1 NAD(P)-dependent iron-only hydrogenase catalytic subunit [Peptoclostridium litorale DSM 5388]
MNMVNITIDGRQVAVPENYTVLDASREIGINIPTLCYLKDINKTGACRMCLVEVEGVKNLQTSCVFPVREGLVVKTNTKRVRDARRGNLQLILSNHHRDCLSCFRNGTCELQTICDDMGLTELEFEPPKELKPVDMLSDSIVRDPNKCILCGRCVAVCNDVQEIGILAFTNRGVETEVAPAFGKSMADSPCIYCGQCINVCPVAALREKTEMDKAWEAIEDESKHVVVATAPAVRAALGEVFGNPIGTRTTGKMFTALKMLGFDKVFDVNFAADLTIMEEGTELLGRIKNGGTLPMITSCSPGWVRYIEYQYPELLDHVSSCKSPQQMMGAMLKSHYAEMNNIDPKDMVVVSIMPCVSKKTEAAKEEMIGSHGTRDIDIVLTTRELGKMIKEARIEFNDLPDSNPDEYYGDYTGAAVIFGTTGGVMEAAIRTVADIVTGKDLEDIEYTAVRGLEGIKEATVKIGDMDVKVAIAHGTANAGKLMELIKEGKADYHFIEIMGCSGGCVTGGGQPHVDSRTKEKIDIRAERAKALYTEDKLRDKRKSHQNPSIQKLYKEYLGEPNGHKAHELLHTHYKKREIL